MKYIKNIPFILLILFFSCGKDPVENPCECGQKPVSANFTIEEEYFVQQFVTDLYVPYDTDTVFFNNIKFTALEEEANYTWTIGSEILHDKVVSRSGFPKGELIPITLYVEKTPDNECFPTDDGKDTLTRYLYRMESNCESLVHGDFHGALVSAPQDTFTVTIDNCAPYPINMPSFFPYINNLKRDCEFMCDEQLVGYKQLAFFAGVSQCDHIFGFAKLNDNDEIQIEFGYATGSNKDKEFIFKGIKKQ